jgi:hypothetical protein
MDGTAMRLSRLLAASIIVFGAATRWMRVLPHYRILSRLPRGVRLFAGPAYVALNVAIMAQEPFLHILQRLLLFEICAFASLK